MKKSFKLFVVMLFVTMGAVSGFAQNPTYTLVANNATPLASITNSIEFDITMTWTGASANY